MSTGDMADGLDRNSIRIHLEPVTIHPSTSEPDASSAPSISYNELRVMPIGALNRSPPRSWTTL
ncbi:hypothetical protein PGTUg99_001929 [Puccinia graminis f. sp. tritici]|uniref:Uncharacterized protein n=1 Tax=Puccinia graminis f. sp. tritici TaxID=56615 RepID=A0A5B0PMR2_PUCGR|nr:hypothetical protein PGTUg99_001929 [Puccinia graminis f. sp. tritici]